MTADTELPPDLWVQLRQQQTNATALREAADKLRKDCAEAHGKKAIVDCPECYRALLTVFRDQFTHGPGKRDGLGAALDALVSKGAEYEVHYRTIDESVAADRRAALYEQLAAMAGVRALAEDLLGRDEAQARLGVLRNPDPAALLTELLSAAGSRGGGAPVADAEAQARGLVDAATPDAAARLWGALLFPDGPPEGSKARELQRQLEAGAPLETLLRQARAADDRARVAHERDRRIKRIAELQRGKAAHEAQKRKKTGGPGAEEGPAGPLEPIVPCAVCARTPELGARQLSCSLCWVEAHLGVREKTAAWCSVECLEVGYPRHLSSDHPCESGVRCLSDKDAAGDVGGTDCFCRECVEATGHRARYCSDRCAVADFRHHRELVHLPGRRKRGVEVDDDADQVVPEGDEAGSYTASDARHVRPYAEVVKAYRAENPGWSAADEDIRLERG